jgi:hypothetical protein
LKGLLRSSALVVFVIAVAGLAVLPALAPTPTARAVREELLAELRPVVLQNCTIERFGSANDGGYLMCGNLLGRAQSAYSYGIGPRDDWGCAISDRLGIPVHQYDCFSPPEAPCANGRSVFHDECIGAKSETIESRRFDTLAAHLARNGDVGKTLVVKIDIEGAELPSLMATPDRIIARFDQLAMEIHGTDSRFLKLVKRLKRHFHVVHLHYNNQSCSVRYKPFPAWAYQVLLVNRRIGVVDPSRPVAPLPHPLDAPDFAIGGDCQEPWPVEP